MCVCVCVCVCATLLLTLQDKIINIVLAAVTAVFIAVRLLVASHYDILLASVSY